MSFLPVVSSRVYTRRENPKGPNYLAAMGRKRSDEVKKRSGYWIESHGGRSYAKANKTVPDQCTRSLQLSVYTQTLPGAEQKQLLGGWRSSVVRAFTAQPDSLSSIPTTYLDEGENRFPLAVLWPPHMCCGMCVCPCIYIYKHASK